MPSSASALSDRWIEIAASPLPIADVHTFLADERAGGTAVFVGTTRRWTDDVETPWIDYDAYRPMALDQLERLVSDAFVRWSPVRIVTLHRTGRVHPTEASVVIGVASPHRAEAFAACRWLIDTLKRDVTIWKREAEFSTIPRNAEWL